MKQYTFSLFKNLFDKTPKRITLNQFAEMVSGGEWSDQISSVRSAHSEEEKKVLKKKLPAVTLSGEFSNGHGADKLKKHSGLICMDFDAKDNRDLKETVQVTRDQIATDKFCRLAFISAGGSGLAVVCEIDPDHHAEAFEFLTGHFKSEYELTADQSCKNVGRLRFVSWDDGAVLNLSSEAVGSKCYVEYVGKSSTSLHLLHNKPVTIIAQKIIAAQDFLTGFEKHPAKNLYRQLIKKNFTAHTGSRNKVLIAQTTLLFHATAWSIAEKFLTAFYWENCQLFNDLIETHLNEARTHWESCLKSYPKELNPAEAEIYSLLEDDAERSLFRICRDLAERKCNGLPNGRFPLSAEQCRLRIGLKFDPQSDRLLKKFVGLYGVLSIQKKGNRRALNKPPRATVYRWLLSER